MPSADEIRVMIADDHPVVCRGLSAIIQSEPGMRIVGEAVNGKEAVDRYRELAPDVALIDLRMPVLSGFDAIRSILQTYPKARIIVLTTYKGDEDVYRALKAGASGYLLKGMPNHELLEAIRNVYRGRRHVPRPVLDMLENRSPASDLSAREREVLELIVKGMSNKQIADTLGITESTVKWHVNLILARLNVSDRTGAAVAALRRGIIEF
jgi:two-component system NarL family response regulator